MGSTGPNTNTLKEFANPDGLSSRGGCSPRWTGSTLQAHMRSGSAAPPPPALAQFSGKRGERHHEGVAAGRVGAERTGRFTSSLRGAPRAIALRLPGWFARQPTGGGLPPAGGDRGVRRGERALVLERPRLETAGQAGGSDLRSEPRLESLSQRGAARPPERRADRGLGGVDPGQSVTAIITIITVPIVRVRTSVRRGQTTPATRAGRADPEPLRTNSCF